MIATGAPDFDARFNEFDAANPGVYELFKKFAFELLSAGRKKMSANMIVERIRWESSIRTTGDQYKVNAIFNPRFARKLASEHPMFSDAFEFRTTGHQGGRQ